MFMGYSGGCGDGAKRHINILLYIMITIWCVMPHIYSMEIEQIPFKKVTVLKFPNFFICRELFFSSVNRWKIVG